MVLLTKKMASKLSSLQPSGWNSLGFQMVNPLSLLVCTLNIYTQSIKQNATHFCQNTDINPTNHNRGNDDLYA
jgi:hypothetical protein